MPNTARQDPPTRLVDYLPECDYRLSGRGPCSPELPAWQPQRIFRFKAVTCTGWVHGCDRHYRIYRSAIHTNVEQLEIRR